MGKRHTHEQLQGPQTLAAFTSTAIWTAAMLAALHSHVISGPGTATRKLGKVTGTVQNQELWRPLHIGSVMKPPPFPEPRVDRLIQSFGWLYLL